MKRGEDWIANGAFTRRRRGCTPVKHFHNRRNHQTENLLRLTNRSATEGEEGVSRGLSLIHI